MLALQYRSWTVLVKVWWLHIIETHFSLGKIGILLEEYWGILYEGQKKGSAVEPQGQLVLLLLFSSLIPCAFFVTFSETNLNHREGNMTANNSLALYPQHSGCSSSKSPRKEYNWPNLSRHSFLEDLLWSADRTSPGKNFMAEIR